MKPYIVYCSDQGIYNEFNTLEEAKDCAENLLTEYRSDAWREGEWTHDVDIKVLKTVVQTIQKDSNQDERESTDYFLMDVEQEETTPTT
jgi:hypothetical protein